MSDSKTGPKRHHFVPRFYLRLYSDRKKRIRMYARDRKAKAILTSVNNAAVESGFYTTLERSGFESQRVERLLSMIEGLAKAAIAKILGGQFPPDIEDRSNLALFMALQMLRTPENRRGYEVMVDYAQKVLLEGWTPDYVRNRMKAKGIQPTEDAVAQIMDVVQNPQVYRFVPHQNEHITIMLDVALKIAPVIAGRVWLLGHSRRSTFVTSDHPVVWRSKPNEMSKYVGVGVGNAEEVYFPLDRHHVLAMALPDTMPDGRYMELTPDNVLFVNSLEAAFSFKWVYQHPDDDPIDYLLPGKPRPLMEINQQPIFER